MARVRPTAGIVAAVVVALAAGCATAPSPDPAPPAVHYPLAPRTVRPGERPLVPAPTTEGDAVFELIGLTTGLTSVLGSHAEWPAKGRFARVRLVVTNMGRTTLLVDANRQVLLTADGAEHVPDSQAMLIKRQPGRIDVGANDRLEFDLYYDVPVDAVVVALRAFGGPSLADFSDTTGVEVRIDTGGS